MASKRPPIEVAEISQNLKNSTGQGINAFFSPTPQPPVTPTSDIKKPSVPRDHGTGVPGNHGTKVPGAKREIARRHPSFARSPNECMSVHTHRYKTISTERTLFFFQSILNLCSKGRIRKQQFDQYPHNLSLRHPPANSPFALGCPASKLVIEIS